MNFSEIIEKINSDKRLVPDLLKSEKGNNFRAVSEATILDVVDPVLKEAGWFYTVEIKKSDLQIREAYGKNGKKLQFIATVEIVVRFEPPYEYLSDNEYFRPIATESVGMGIDDNDKAMGKAFTYALKYALLKVFRLRYSDDPDFKASEPLHVDPPKEAEKAKPVKKKNGESEKKDIPMSEKQRDYILGMMEKKGISEQVIISKWGYEPSIDEFIPMPVAREIIKFLEQHSDLPF